MICSAWVQDTLACEQNVLSLGLNLGTESSKGLSWQLKNCFRCTHTPICWTIKEFYKGAVPDCDTGSFRQVAKLDFLLKPHPNLYTYKIFHASDNLARKHGNIQSYKVMHWYLLKSVLD